ncbi:MAG: YdcF family protein [Geminicoccales bacterium]
MFALSKLFWVLVQPSNFLLLLLVIASAGLLLGYRSLGTWLLCGVTAVLVLITVLPIGSWLLIPIENRFPPPDAPDDVDGVIMLGGALDVHTSAARAQAALNEAAERVTTLIELGTRYPDARLVISGGIGRLLGAPVNPAETLKGFYRDQGFDVGRILFEDQSRNTYENAVFAKRRVQPAPGERWLLVTSAYHMPRSVGVFRQAGWPVIAYPVDYRTTGRPDLQRTLDQLVQPSVSDRLFELDLAIKAWVGLLAYRLMGRTSALFPAP